MEFRTKVDIGVYGRTIDHTRNGLSLGSCFASNISARMRRAKFRICTNPFGILFNPVSIADTILRMDSDRLFEKGDLSYHNGLWNSFAFHGSFSSPDADTALAAMNRAVREGGEALRKADYVIITFGTSWVYELAESTGTVAANCHKFPAEFFRRRRLTVREIVERYNTLWADILKDKQIILTVSPVRHIKDGLAENTLSKAVLIEAVHELVGTHANADYLPAFEIMNDELRDYRFYADDMVHPSTVAIDYIWERFGDAFLSERAREASGEAEKLADAMEHRPLYPGSPEHMNFHARMYDRAVRLSERYPEIDFSEEMLYFKR